MIKKKKKLLGEFQLDQNEQTSSLTSTESQVNAAFQHAIT